MSDPGLCFLTCDVDMTCGAFLRSHMEWCSAGAGPGSTQGVPFPRGRGTAEVTSQPRPTRRATPLKTHHAQLPCRHHTACLLTSLDFSAVRNPSNLSCQTETYKKLTHTVILRDAITVSLPGGLCWNSPGSHGPWLSRVRRRQRATRLCRGGGHIFTM